MAASVFVTANLFNMLGRSAALGRAFAAGEEAPVVVLSDGYWRRRFGADPGIVGKSLTLYGTPFQVIGVMPPDFVFPYPGMLGPSGFTRVTSIDMWLPISFSGPIAASNRMLTSSGEIVRSAHWWGAIGRVKPGVAVAAGRGRHEANRRAARAGVPGHEQGLERHRRALDRSVRRGDPAGVDDPARRHRVRAAHGVGERRESAARPQRRP